MTMHTDGRAFSIGVKGLVNELTFAIVPSCQVRTVL
jgi:hypothetical protein